MTLNKSIKDLDTNKRYKRINKYNMSPEDRAEYEHGPIVFCKYCKARTYDNWVIDCPECKGQFCNDDCLDNHECKDYIED